ncbi:MAG: DUF3341 domain-containing protein [Rhizobiaceae bacterium]|jgi:hypothetical protein
MTAAILARFEHEEALVNAIGRLRERDFQVLDAFTPYEVKGIGALLGASPFLVRAAMLIGGLGTAALCWFIEWYSAAIDFPFNSGSRPHNSWPVFPLFPFEFGVLMAGVFGFAAMLWSTGLPRLNHPFFDSALTDRASQDAFLLAIDIPPTARARRSLERLLAEIGAATVVEAEL